MEYIDQLQDLGNSAMEMWSSVSHGAARTSEYNPLAWDTPFMRLVDEFVIGVDNYNFPKSNDNTYNRDNRFYDDWAKYHPVKDLSGASDNPHIQFMYPFDYPPSKGLIKEYVTDPLGYDIEMFSEKNATIYSKVIWLRNQWPIALIGASLYIAMVFIGPMLMKNREGFKLKWTTAFWNLALAIFSLIGTLRVAPVTLTHIFKPGGIGWVGILCTEGEQVNMSTAALWTMLFVHSKYFEFFDTVLLILKKKPIIFLHWWHHFTVFMYCWEGAMNQITGGMIFSPMNYFVHSIMYFYYFLMAVGHRPKWAKFVTYIQILQMVIGLFTVGSHFLFWTRVKNCDGSGKDFFWALVIYGSYLTLFVKFFIGKYMAAPKPKDRQIVKAKDD